MIRQSFEGILDARSGYMQQPNNGQRLNNRKPLSSMSKADSNLALATKSNLELLKDEWAQRMNNNNVKVKELLNYYFGSLYCVIQENQKVFVP